MADCPTDKDTYNAINGPAGFDNAASRANSISEITNMEALHDAALRTEKLLGEESLSTEAATATAPAGEPLTADVQKMARAISKRAMKFWNWSKLGQQEVLDAADRAQRLVDGTTQQNATFWMNFQNAQAKWFVNNRNDMNFFGDLFVHEKGKRPHEQAWYKEFTGMTPKIRGQASIFQDYIQKNILDYCAPFARRGMYSGKEIAGFGGDYLNCLHAPESNAHVLSYWRDTIVKNEQTIRQYELALQRKSLLQQQAAITQQVKALRKEKNPDAAQLDKLQSDYAALTKRLNDMEAVYVKADAATYDNLRRLKPQNTQYARQIEELEANLENPNPPDNLVRGGYTNAQARILMAEIERQTGMSKPELEELARRISRAYDFIAEEQAKAGMGTPEQYAAIPDFKWYAPQMSKRMNFDAPSNDATHYTPVARHVRGGMMGNPDSAFTTLGYAARRAATEIGSRDFGLLLAAAERKFARIKDGNPDFISPILSFNDHELSGMELSGSLKERQIARSIRANNGFVVNVPVTGKDGVRSYERRYYWFNPEWSSGTLTGESLNRALSSNYKLGSTGVELVAKATSYYGQSVTRFLPGFSIVGGTRDFTERLMHIANQDYYLENGDHISGASLVGRYAANLPRAGGSLLQAMRGKAEAGSENAVMWDEFRRNGLFQKFVHGIGRAPQTLEQLKSGGQTGETLRNWGLDKQADWLQHKNFATWRRVINTSGELGRRFLRLLDNWNDWWQNLPAYTHYVTLRKAGVPAAEAAANVRSIMDFSQTGSVTQMLAVIAPFVRPTMQGAAAFGRTLGLSGRNLEEVMRDGKRGWMAGLAATMAFGTLLPLVRESWGTDEKGNSRMDAQPISRLTQSFQVGIGDDDLIKLPVGFGPVRVAYAMSLAMDRVWRGIMEPTDAAFEVLFAAARDTVPGNNPMFNFGDKPAEFITQYFCPAPLKPFLELSQNTNAFGGPIYQEGRSFDKAAADQGRKNTPAVWHRVARDMYDATGFDAAPEAYMHLAKGLMLGPATLISRGITSFAEKDEPYLGMNKPTALREMPPALATLGGTLFYGKIRDPSKDYFYRATNDLMKKAQRAGVDMTQDSKSGEEGRAIVEQKLLAAGLDTADIEDIMRIRAARAALIAQSSAFTRQHQRWYDEPDAEVLKQDFEKLFMENEQVYKDAYLNLNYYK